MQVMQITCSSYIYIWRAGPVNIQDQNLVATVPGNTLDADEIGKKITCIRYECRI